MLRCFNGKMQRGRGNLTMKHNRGFTLIELIIIIALLASATAVAAPNIFGAESKAETEACRDQMDLLLNGFQTQQFSATSSYAFSSLTDGEAKLNAYLANATDAVQYINVGMSEPAKCPSDAPTAYQAKIVDGKLFVYCPNHGAASHSGLSAREREPDVSPYTNLQSWTSTDGNWIVGDHESFFVLPIEDQYYHMEIGFQLVLYDDGDDLAGDPIYEYRYDDPDWYLPIPTAESVEPGTLGYYENIKPIYGTDATRPLGYDLATFNATNQDLAFALAIDFQETDDGINFSSNALELKNVNSNAVDEVTMDVMKESEFEPELTVNKIHQRDLFDGQTDWLIIDVVPKTETTKTLIVHMLDGDDQFQQLFATDVQVADPSKGKVQFAFFMGKRSESVDPKLKNGFYYSDAFPTPVQLYMEHWEIDYDATHEASGKDYSYWYGTSVNYNGFMPYLTQ